VGDGLFALSILATTGTPGGIGGHPLPFEAIIGGLVIVALPYAIAVAVGARRGALGTMEGRLDCLRAVRGAAVTR
jgi:hypothetical protein